MKLFVLSLVGIALAGTNKEGLEYLAKRDKEEGVVKLDSGVRYKVLKKGEGKWRPRKDAPVKIHYTGHLVDGTKYGSSYDIATGEPMGFKLDLVIKGWGEAMQKMVEGDKWEIILPSEVGYGDNGDPPRVPGGNVAIITTEMIEIQGKKKRAAQCNVVTGDACNEEESPVLDKYKTQNIDELKSALKQVEERSQLVLKSDERKRITMEESILNRLIKSKKTKKVRNTPASGLSDDL